MGPRKPSGGNASGAGASNGASANPNGAGAGAGAGEGDADYQSKRARNNEAVKRSREKARQRARETHDRVSKLKQENERLEERIKLLSKELTFLKDIFLAHAGGKVVVLSLKKSIYGSIYVVQGDSFEL